jgi:hypothetical protein
MRFSDLKKLFSRLYAAYAILSIGTEFHWLTTAITANSTLTSAPAGSFAITSHATGRGALFYSDGTKWQASNSAEGAELVANKDASAGYVGKTLQKINFTNAAADIVSFLVNAATVARTYTFPDKDITVAGIVDIPVKATGAEANTGTDDAKFVTAKTLKDADLAKAAATPVSLDEFYFRTAAGVVKKVTLADLATAIDGELNP